MSGPIKPPSHKPVGVRSADESTSPEAASRVFREDLVTVPEIPSERPQPLGSVDPALAGLVADIREGRVAPAAAVDALVERTLASPVARALAPEARARLESTLRAQLRDDPALAELVADLDRDR